MVTAGRSAERRPWLTGTVFFLGLTLLGLAALAYAGGVRVNLSGSIPPGLYRETSGRVTRGVIVLACLPPGVSSFARARGYVPSGSCDDGSAPVGKVVVAQARDTVDITTGGVSVNGRLLPNSAPLEQDSNGRPLPTLRIAKHVVASGEVWLVSSYSRHSFDSRYFGGIATTRVIERIEPLLTRK